MAPRPGELTGDPGGRVGVEGVGEACPLDTRSDWSDSSTDLRACHAYSPMGLLRLMTPPPVEASGFSGQVSGSRSGGTGPSMQRIVAANA